MAPAGFSAKPDWAATRKRIAATLHVRAPLPNLEAKKYQSFAVAAGIAADRVSYATDYSLRVAALVYREAGPTIERHPAPVIVNGHGGDKSSWYAYWAGILYARAGAVVLTYDPIGEFERNRERLSDTNQHDTLLQPEDMGRRMTGLMITDVLQAVSYLATRPDVDAKRIAVLGYSLGSFVSALSCALDERVHACVLAAGGDLDGAGGYWDKSNPMCQGIAYRSLAFLGNRGATIYALNAHRGPTLVINGTADQVVEIPQHGPEWLAELRKQTEQITGKSKDLFDAEFVAGGGHRPYFVTRQAALWLNEKLKFPNWNKKSIEAAPETLAADWAGQHGLTDRRLQDRHNEGGTVALGDNIAVVPRDQSHAIPEVIWDTEYRDYIYETWVERAKAAIESGAP